MLDGSVPDEVFERLRSATAARADSLRPPADGTWSQEEQAEPRGYGRILAIAAAVAVAGFVAYQQLTADARHPLPPPVRNAGAASVAPIAPQVAPAPTVDSLRPTVEASPAREPSFAPTVAPVPPAALEASEAAHAKHAVPRTQLRREEPAVAEPRPSAREQAPAQPAAPAPRAASTGSSQPWLDAPAIAQPAVQEPPRSLAPTEPRPAEVRPAEARPAEARSKPRVRSEGLPDNPY